MSTLQKDQKIGFFVHVPKNFLRPYGPAEGVPDTETVLKRTSIKNCKWLVPHPVMIKKKSFKQAVDNVTALTTNLAPFNLHGEGQCRPEDIGGGCTSGCLHEGSIYIGGALMTMSTNYLVARTYVRNPDVYAAAINMSSGATTASQQSSSSGRFAGVAVAGKRQLP